MGTASWYNCAPRSRSSIGSSPFSSCLRWLHPRWAVTLFCAASCGAARYSTLVFASRAKRVRVNPVVNLRGGAQDFAPATVAAGELLAAGRSSRRRERSQSADLGRRMHAEHHSACAAFEALFPGSSCEFFGLPPAFHGAS